MLDFGGFTLERAGSFVARRGDVGKWFVGLAPARKCPPPTLPASGRGDQTFPARLREGSETCRATGEVSRSGVGISGSGKCDPLADSNPIRHDDVMTPNLRPIAASDLPTIVKYDFTVSINQSMADPCTLRERLDETGFWEDDAGARAIEVGGRLVGTCQFYRAAPCIHGYELGYIVHDPANRGRGYAAEALRLLTDLLYFERPSCYRLQLVIEVWNTASWKVAERCGYVREGLLRSAGFGRGDPSDCFVYGRVRKDWFEQRHANPSMGGGPTNVL